MALYVSTKNEVATEYLLDIATNEGKTIFLPRVRQAEKGMMDFAICHGPQDLKPGAYSIREPDPSICPGCVFTALEECPVVPDNIIVPPPDIFIIPGVAFDRAGHRLGFGGGYYDRFLANPLLRAHSKFIALAYNFQIVESIPSASWDQPVDAICTDMGYFPVESHR